MATKLNTLIKRLPKKRRAKVEARAAQLIAEEMTLRDLRRAMALTQKRMAKKLGVGQDSISRLEQRSDMLLSTLESYVKALGGDLQVIAVFPNRPPVSLRQLTSLRKKAAGE